MAALAAGQSLAFDEPVVRWGGRVEAYLRHLLGDAAWAEDLTQEVFVKVHAGLHSREPGRSFRVWLFRIARNEGLDSLRRRSLQRRLIHALAAGLGPLARSRRRSAPSPPTILETAELLADLEHSLGELPEAQRSVFLLREREGLAYEEIAEIVGCSAKTVSTRWPAPVPSCGCCCASTWTRPRCGGPIMTDPQPCARVGALLSEHLDGRLEGRRARAVTGHLRRCRHCRVELEALRQLGLAAAALAAPAPDPTLAARARGELEPEPLARLLPWTLGLGGAAAAVAACLVAYELGRRSTLGERDARPEGPAGLVRMAPLEDAAQEAFLRPLPPDETALLAARSLFADLELVEAVPAALRDPLLDSQLKHYGLDRWAAERGARMPALAPIADLLRELEQILDAGFDEVRLAELRRRAGDRDLWERARPGALHVAQTRADLERLLEELGADLPGETRLSMGEWVLSKESWLRDGGDAAGLEALVRDLAGRGEPAEGAFLFTDLGGLLEQVQWTVGEDGSRRGELHLQQELPGGRRVIHFEAHGSRGAPR